MTRAAMVLLKYPSLELVEYKWPASPPPCLTFQVFFPSANTCAAGSVGDAVAKAGFSVCRGHGISHPRRLGVASHFGLLVMCRPLAWRKNGSAVNSNRSQRTGRAGPTDG